MTLAGSKPSELKSSIMSPSEIRLRHRGGSYNRARDRGPCWLSPLHGGNQINIKNINSFSLQLHKLLTKSKNIIIAVFYMTVTHLGDLMFKRAEFLLIFRVYKGDSTKWKHWKVYIYKWSVGSMSRNSYGEQEVWAASSAICSFTCDSQSSKRCDKFMTSSN